MPCQSGASSPEGSDKQSMCVCITQVVCPEPFHLPPYLCGYENCMCKPGTEQISVDATISCQDCEAGSDEHVPGIALGFPCRRSHVRAELMLVYCVSGKAKGTWGSSDACEDCVPGFFTPFGSYGTRELELMCLLEVRLSVCRTASDRVVFVRLLCVANTACTACPSGSYKASSGAGNCTGNVVFACRCHGAFAIVTK